MVTAIDDDDATAIFNFGRGSFVWLVALGLPWRYYVGIGDCHAFLLAYERAFNQ